jgi:PAS domain S-box-containing protein
MNNKTLSILYVGNTAVISKEMVMNNARFTSCTITNVNTFQEFAGILRVRRPDIILVAHKCESLDAATILANLDEQGLKIPVILLINAADEDQALDLLNIGLSDYLLLEHLKRLPNAIKLLVDKYRIQRQNDQRYQYLYDQDLAGLYTSSVKGTLLDCNVAFATMLGYDKPEELVGQQVTGLFLVAADRDKLIENLQSNKQLRNYESMLVRKDGKTIHLLENIYLATDELSGEEILQGIMLDITQLVTTKQNIIRARTMLSEGQQLAGMGNWNYNVQKKELTISPGMCDIFGLSKSDSLSLRQFLSMIDPVERKRVVLEVIGLKDIGGKTKDTFKVFLKDNKVISVAAVHTQDLDDKGGVLRYYGVLQDVTALQSAEKERDRITAELVKRNRALEQFTYVISHNLRAPVANIIALIEILDQSYSDLEGIDLIDRMSRSVANLDAVITDLNLILQVKQQQNSAREEIDFDNIISSIRLSIGNLIVQENVQFEIDFSCGSSIVAVRSYLYSIFYNLTLNSIKYRNPTLSPVIKITCSLKDGILIIKFQDNGKGIDLAKNGQQLFGLYKRFDSTIDGKGMGLFMVKSQVEDLGGTIEVESELFLGTTFIIRLPGQ